MIWLYSGTAQVLPALASGRSNGLQVIARLAQWQGTDLYI